jgi:hypothetical protein
MGSANVSGVFAGILPYRSFSTVLANSSTTDCYTVGDDSEDEIILAGVEVVAADGSTPTAAKVEHYKLSNTTSFSIVPTTNGLPTATEQLVYECLPGRHMKRGDEVRVTAAAAHHVTVSFWKIGSSPGQKAQG